MVLGIFGSGRGGHRSERADISQRLETLHRRGIRLRGGVAWGLGKTGGDPLEIRRQPPANVPPRGGQVLPLPGIGPEIVELGLRRSDVLPLADSCRPQLTPAEVQPRIPALRNRHRNLTSPSAVEQCLQTFAAGWIRLPGRAGEPRNRRRDVDAPHLLGDDAGGEAGTGHDQWNPKRGVVEEEPVIRLAVLTKRFTVVGRHHDHRARPVHPAEQLADLGIHVGDFGIVGTAGCRRRVAWRRVVRQMRIVVMHPQEPAAGLAFDPAASRSRHLRRAALQVRGGHGRAHRSGDRIVVLVESLRQPVRLVEDDTGDHRPGVVALRLEAFGERVRAGGQRVHAVQPQAEGSRIAAGEDRGV